MFPEQTDPVAPEHSPKPPLPSLTLCIDFGNVRVFEEVNENLGERHDGRLKKESEMKKERTGNTLFRLYCTL